MANTRIQAAARRSRDLSRSRAASLGITLLPADSMRVILAHFFGNHTMSLPHEPAQSRLGSDAQGTSKIRQGRKRRKSRQLGRAWIGFRGLIFDVHG